MRVPALALLGLIVGLVATSFAQPERPEERNIVARAGDVFITESEFVQRFEMLPALYRQKNRQLDIEKLNLVSSIIAEKLLAQEALSRNLDEDPGYQRAFLEIRKMLARDQLYREEISSKVVLDNEDIKKAVKDAQRQVFLEFLFFEKEDDAVFIRSQMKSAGDFESLEFDSSLSALRDTATIIWGDADYGVEQAAYQLRPQEISQIVKAGSGYYILKCKAITPSSFFSSLQPAMLRDRVVTKIRQRKERELMDKFLSHAFHGKVGYAKPLPLKQLAQSLVTVFGQDAQSHPDDVVAMDSVKANHLRVILQNTLNDTLAVVGDTYWSVDDVIERLKSKQFTVHANGVAKLPAKLNGELGFMVQQDLLGQEALSRGLDQRPEVKPTVELWKNAMLADRMKMLAKRLVSISDEEVWKYMQYRDPAAAPPEVQIRDLRTNSLDEMQSALAQLQEGVPFEQVIAQWSNDINVGEQKGLTSFFPITERSPVGSIAAQMEIGQRYGPIRADDGIHFFEFVAKRPSPLQTDTAFAALKENASKELLAMKQRKTLTLFLAQVARKRGFEIYQDRLLQLEVTPIPMMTFRYLGFGGRMFETPFVEPQLEWLDVDPPKEAILP